MNCHLDSAPMEPKTIRNERSNEPDRKRRKRLREKLLDNVGLSSEEIKQLRVLGCQVVRESMHLDSDLVSMTSIIVRGSID